MSVADLAAKAVSVLLDSEEDEDAFLIHDIARSSLNPGHEFVEAMRQGMGIVRYFYAPDPWAFDMWIRISEVTIPTKLRQIHVHWERPEKYQLLAAEQDEGGGYASYDVKDADELGRRLAALIKASKVSTVGDATIRSAYMELWVMHWMRKTTPRGRRR